MSQLSPDKSKNANVSMVMSGMDPNDNYILSVLTKRTYCFSLDTRCWVSEEQIPLVQNPIYYEKENSALEYDTDLFPYKIATDVIIKGNAYPPIGQTAFFVCVAIGMHIKTIRVFGDRKCWRTHTGSLRFTEPQFSKRTPLPLRYERAYGGKDSIAEAKYGDPLEPLQKYLHEEVNLKDSSPYAYPRNPCGLGYIIEINKDSLENTLLPNFEDPKDLLTPERLAVGRIGCWPYMPLPQAFDWYDYSWFPRLAFLGLVPKHEPLDKPLKEAQRGYVPSDIMQEKSIIDGFSYQIANGSCPGLSFPYLTGNETVILTNVHPTYSKLVFTLPGQRPAILVYFYKKKQKLPAVLHTVVIEPEIGRLSLLWRGSLVVQRPYLPEELEKIQFSIAW